MLRYDDLQVFVHTSDSGSLSAAARQLEISPAVASAALKRLESELEVRLFARSTRSLRLTPEGDAFLLHARASLRSLEEGRRLLQGGKDQIAGVLQLSAPSDFGRNLLLPWLDEFQARYPQLSLRLLLGDRVTDLYRQPVDVAIRYGAPADSSLVACRWRRTTGECSAPRRATWRSAASRASRTTCASTIACSTNSAAGYTTAGRSSGAAAA